MLNICVFGFAQKSINEGVVTSKQTLSSEDDQVNMQLAMIGQIITTTWFKNDKSRSEISNPMIGNSIIVIDMAINKMMMKDNAIVGKKYVLKDLASSESQIENLSVVETAETKTILGYVCKKYEVTIVKNGKGTEMTLYTTDKISAKSPQVISLGDLITGYPMLIEMKMSQMGTEILGSMEATNIVSEEISTTKFDMTPIEGYEKTEQLEM